MGGSDEDVTGKKRSRVEDPAAAPATTESETTKPDATTESEGATPADGEVPAGAAADGADAEVAAPAAGEAAPAPPGITAPGDDADSGPLSAAAKAKRIAAKFGALQALTVPAGAPPSMPGNPGLGASEVRRKVYFPKTDDDIDFVKLLIGPGGSTHRSLEEQSGAKIHIKGEYLAGNFLLCLLLFFLD